jgi:hypothetical protein
MSFLLNQDNYQRGFLVDDELLAGVTQHPEKSGFYVAFVLRYTTGEYLGYDAFSDLPQAINAINQISRAWIFEALNDCGSHDCSKPGCGKAESCSQGRHCAS